MWRGFVRAVWLAGALVALVPIAGRAGDVNVNVNIGAPPPVVVSEPPRLRLVPRSPVYYAPSVPYNFFYYDGRYYTYHEDEWFWGASVRGPWIEVAIGRVPRPVLAVPVAYYKVPPGQCRKHGPPPWAGHGKHRGRGHGKGHD